MRKLDYSEELSQDARGMRLLYESESYRMERINSKLSIITMLSLLVSVLCILSIKR
jgi:hypothetical protein